jgi:Uma2 family endonuclease
MGQPATSHPDRFTYGDYYNWDDGERWELIDGEAYCMSPAPTRLHQEILGGMHAQIYASLAGKPCRVYMAPFDIRLPKGNEADALIDTVVQPDISVICESKKLDDRGCRGAPDWIIEILSPSTAARDQIRKRDLYEREGVREYWLVHPQDKMLYIYRLVDSGYGPPEILPTEGITPVACLAGVEIDWARVFLPD